MFELVALDTNYLSRHCSTSKPWPRQGGRRSPICACACLASSSWFTLQRSRFRIGQVDQAQKHQGTATDDDGWTGSLFVSLRRPLQALSIPHGDT